MGQPTELWAAMNVQVAWARLRNNSIIKGGSKHKLRRGHSRCVHIEYIMGADGRTYEHRIPVYSSRNSMNRLK